MYGSKIGKIMIWDEEEDIFEQAVSSIFLIHTDESVIYIVPYTNTCENVVSYTRKAYFSGVRVDHLFSYLWCVGCVRFLFVFVLSLV
jgi:hypothetical protein